MRRKFAVVSNGAAVPGTATRAFGAGFKIAEQGAKAMAMGASGPHVLFRHG